MIVHTVIHYVAHTDGCAELANCLINAQPLPAHRLAAAQRHDLTDDWWLPNAHLVDS